MASEYFSISRQQRADGTGVDGADIHPAGDDALDAQPHGQALDIHVVHFLFAADDGIIGGVFRAKLDIIGVEVDAL